MASLLCQEHPDSSLVGERTELIFGSTFIGRGRLSDIRVEEPSVPRKAAELRRLHDGGYVVIPLKENSVEWNGEPLDSHRPLSQGDLLKVGGAVLEFHVEEEEDTTLQPAAETVTREESSEPEAGTRKASLLQAVFRLLFGTLASRFLGLAREVVMACYVGAGAAMDIFVVAFTIPNLFRRVLGEAAMESAFLPTFKTFLSRGDRRSAWRLASTICNVLTLLLAVVVVILYFLAPILVKVLAPGFSEELAAQTVRLTRAMLPFTLFIGVAAILGSLLLAQRRYLAYSLAPTMFNVGAIVCIVLLHEFWGLYSLALGVVVGGAGQMLVQVHAFRRRGDRDAGYRPIIDTSHPGARKILSLSGPIMLTSLIDKVGEASKRIIASFLLTGSIASLAYAFRLIHLPFAIIGLALSRAVLPFLAEQNALNDMDGFRRQLVRGLNLCAFLMIPTSVGVAVLSVPMVETLFAHGEWGRSNPQATSMTALAVVFYAIGLWCMSTVSILTRAFHAMLDTRAPLHAGLYGFAINIILSICLALTPLAHAGLALAVSVDYFAQVGLMLRALRKRFVSLGGGFELTEVVRPLGPIAIASGLMGLTIGLGASMAWPGTDAGIFHRALVLLALISVGAAVYAALTLALAVPEARQLAQKISRRVFRRS